MKDFPGQPDNWYKIKIFNNMIVNNVAANKGAGIFMQDVLRGYILQNTIINNDSTATSSLSFQAGAANSTPQASGVVTAVNSDALQLILATSGPTERIIPTRSWSITLSGTTGPSTTMLL